LNAELNAEKKIFTLPVKTAESVIKRLDRVRKNYIPHKTMSAMAHIAICRGLDHIEVVQREAIKIGYTSRV